MISRKVIEIIGRTLFYTYKISNKNKKLVHFHHFDGSIIELNCQIFGNFKHWQLDSRFYDRRNVSVMSIVFIRIRRISCLPTCCCSSSKVTEFYQPRGTFFFACIKVLSEGNQPQRERKTFARDILNLKEFLVCLSWRRSIS